MSNRITQSPVSLNHTERLGPSVDANSDLNAGPPLNMKAFAAKCRYEVNVQSESIIVITSVDCRGRRLILGSGGGGEPVKTSLGGRWDCSVPFT